jgi:hypothetical protein
MFLDVCFIFLSPLYFFFYCLQKLTLYGLKICLKIKTILNSQLKISPLNFIKKNKYSPLKVLMLLCIFFVTYNIAMCYHIFILFGHG